MTLRISLRSVGWKGEKKHSDIVSISDFILNSLIVNSLLFAAAMEMIFEDDFGGQGSLAIAKEDSDQVRHNVSISGKDLFVLNKQNESKGESYLQFELS